MEHELLLEKILKQSEETQKVVTALDKKIDLHIQKTEIELSYIRELDREQNRILDEHQKRCSELERDNILREQLVRQDFEKRIQEVETPQKWMKTTVRYIIVVSSAVSTILGLKQLWGHFGSKLVSIWGKFF